MEDNSTDVPDKAQLQDKSDKAYSPGEAYFSSLAKIADVFPCDAFSPYSSKKYLIDMCLQDGVHIASLTGHAHKVNVTDYLQTTAEDEPPPSADKRKYASDIDQIKSDVAEIKNKQVTEAAIRAIVRQEVDRERLRKPARRRPPLTQKAIRLAFEMWAEYCHNPAAVGCGNGRKVTYADVFETFRSKFASCGINDLADFKRAIESSRKSMPDEWKRLKKQRSRAR